jgi:hypothetical protein
MAGARGNSSVGRASASQAEGRGFESRFPLRAPGRQVWSPFRSGPNDPGARAVSSVGSEHLAYTEGVGGSSPSPPTPPPARLAGGQRQRGAQRCALPRDMGGPAGRARPELTVSWCRRSLPYRGSTDGSKPGALGCWSTAVRCESHAVGAGLIAPEGDVLPPSSGTCSLEISCPHRRIGTPLAPSQVFSLHHVTIIPYIPPRQ